VLFLGSDLQFSPALKKLLSAPALAGLTRAIKADGFKGKIRSSLVVPAPQGLDADRVIIVGLGDDKEQKDIDNVRLGGAAIGKIGASKAVTLFALGTGQWKVTGETAADIALGMRLGAYKFDKYQTKKKDNGKGESNDGPVAATIALDDVADARKAAKTSDAIGDGVILARDLVNEPPNVLDPVEFARRAEELKKLGVEITTYDEKQLARLGMRALLAVGQGSRKESRVVVMKWNGAKSAKGAKAQPLAIIGKGVCFDSGGISIKPAQGMEDVKGDMGGAACVTGLMHTLAARKAKANVIGVIGLVENMPDGNAQRPGDIVTSLSGQTIEIINTDAEGRLVLCDLLWHVKESFKPSAMVNLATLTGAILVALGQENAGLFSNNDNLSDQLTKAGKATGETVWRMPMSATYDKMMDSKFADMKNAGGRYAGSITAAQFLQRFVGETPWAHLDIAGTAMASPESEINKSWGSGWGVRLLDRMIAEHYES
jgi:leucyl aminopeptidase